MEFKGQGPTNTNHHVSQPHPAPRAAEGSSFTMMNQESNKKPMVIVGIIAAIVVVLGLGWWLYTMFMSPDGIKKDRYQAIFLTNGQVYFCKLANVNASYVDCTDIYYLQVQQSSTVQPADNKTAGQNPQVELAKLGKELHGPDDQMHISRDQVLFWENLKDDSKVVDAIKKNQEQK